MNVIIKLNECQIGSTKKKLPNSAELRQGFSCYKEIPVCFPPLLWILRIAQLHQSCDRYYYVPKKVRIFSKTSKYRSVKVRILMKKCLYFTHVSIQTCLERLTTVRLVDCQAGFSSLCIIIDREILSQPNNNHNPDNKTTITVVCLRQSNRWEPPPPTQTQNYIIGQK